MSVTVEAGLMFIQDIFQDPQDVQSLKHKVAEIQGVLGSQIQDEFVL